MGILRSLLLASLAICFSDRAFASGCNSGALATPQATVTAASGDVANASAVATLAAPAQNRWNIVGFEITATGSTAALGVISTLAGLDNGNGGAVSASYAFTFPAGATVAATPLVVSYPCPITGLPGTAVVLTLPAGGAGNLHADVTIHAFQSP